MQGEASDPDASEQAILGDAALSFGERLACRVTIGGDLKVSVPATSVTGRQRLQLDGKDDALVPLPSISTQTISVSPPSLEDARSDEIRIVNALTSPTSPSNSEYAMEPSALNRLSTFARKSRWHFDAMLRGTQIIGAVSVGEPIFGVAVDLGTTKIAALLVNLVNGKELAVAGAMNPQIAYGEDLISRMHFAQQNDDGAEVLAGEVRKTIDGLIDELVQKSGIDRQQIGDMCVVGNTTMTHLLLGLPTAQLSQSPFVAATDRAVDVTAGDLGLNVAPGANVHLLPSIGGFVGADHVAMILASRLDRCETITLGIDIGTNTEIALADPQTQRLACASCASGPAFEGAHVGDGMRASSGAIESVTIGSQGVEIQTIDNAPAVGLCGSGMVDVIAELLRCNALNNVGRLDNSSQLLRQGDSGPELLLESADRSGSGRDVVITQKDISQIQLAKGAIRAGLEALLASTNTSADKVGEVVVAGAFGAFLDIGNAFGIGLLPQLPNARYSQVGNAALVGAKRALLSVGERRRAVAIAGSATHLELSTYPNFSRIFTRGMLFPEIQSDIVNT
jgi:uncharacterized 2Fe-2S/4Fe-4S cluster protein (DUF4445 family)